MLGMNTGPPITGVVFILVSLSVAFDVQRVDIGGCVTLPCNGTSLGEWRVRSIENKDEQLVASFSGEAGPGFENRVRISNDLKNPRNRSLTLNPVKYFDKGIYECLSNSGEILSEVRLEVLVPRMHYVVNGDPLTLQCYLDIRRQADFNELDFVWYKDGQIIYQVRHNKTTYDPGFENRTVFSPKSALEGNMSLTIQQTRMSDQGEYWCSSNNPEQKGNPESHSVTVTDSSLSGGYITGIVTGIVTVIAALVIWCVLKKKCLCRCEEERRIIISKYPMARTEGSENDGSTSEDQYPEQEIQPALLPPQPPEPETQPPEPETQPLQPVPRMSVMETQPAEEEKSTQPWM